MSKQLDGYYKISEYTKLPNGRVKKRTIHKWLTLTSAEDIVYRLEKNRSK